ncbi:MAG: type II toxin-antitoxin system VapC family toxin [Euryarchaeota archaeon]|nr:type II toxin-antitoxin system VapC family toxin [Euryarchaeota archaeon]
MIIFDSTFLIDLMISQNNPKCKNCISLLGRIVNGDEAYGTTFANVFELYKGAYKSDNIEKSKAKINDILSNIPVLDFSTVFYDSYGELSTELEKKGTPIGKFDELIAAIALYHNAKIVTNNTRDFSKVSGIEIINH